MIILCKLDIPEVGYTVLHSHVDSNTPCNYTYNTSNGKNVSSEPTEVKMYSC